MLQKFTASNYQTFGCALLLLGGTVSTYQVSDRIQARQRQQQAPAISQLPFFKSWLVFAVITTFGGGLLGAIVGMIIGGIMGGAGATVPTTQLITAITGLVLGTPISFLTYKWSVNKFIVAHMLRTIAALSIL